MSLYALPTITEKAFADYISGNYEGAYSVSRGFTVQEFVLPLILITAGQFVAFEPDTHLYQGKVVVSINTQIDDQTDPIAMHDQTVAAIYDLLADKTGALAALNTEGGSFHCFNFDIVSYDQDITERTVMSLIELTIHCQTLEVT